MIIKRALNVTLGTMAGNLHILLLIGFVVLAIFFIGQRFRLFGQDISLAPTSLANVEAGRVWLVLAVALIGSGATLWFTNG